MEKKRFIKLRNSSGIAKRIDFPKNFNELVEKAKTFLPLDEKTKKYQFIDENVNREIHHQEDYELFANHIFEKPIKILVNIIDKEKGEIEEKKNSPEVFKNTFIEESVNISIIPNTENQEDASNDKLEKDIKRMVKDKIKEFENNIIEDIYQSIKAKMEISEDSINLNNNKNEIIHNGIKCNVCNKENIKGVRYMCTKCDNYNICSNCEQNIAHDPGHIFIKIRKPLKEEKELLTKINKDLKYKNREYNYSVEPTNMEFKINNKEMNVLSQQITLKNTGNKPWEGAIFKCLPHSQIRGKSIDIKKNVNEDTTVDIEIIFENFKDKLKPSVNEYYVYYQMFNNKKEAFGNITKFKVIFKE